MKKLIKKLAAHIMAPEIAALRMDAERMRLLAFGRNYVILPSSAASCIVDMLPNPNAVATGQLGAQALLRLNDKESVRRYVYVLRGREYSSEIRIVADTRPEEEKKAEQGLMIELMDFHIKIFIPLIKAKMNTQVAGVNTEVESWIWDLYRAGIRVVGDTDFNMIMEFVIAQNNVLKELNEEM